jgi:hypothetical protein
MTQTVPRTQNADRLAIEQAAPNVRCASGDRGLMERPDVRPLMADHGDGRGRSANHAVAGRRASVTTASSTPAVTMIGSATALTMAQP